MLQTLPLSARAETTALKQPKELFSFSRNVEGRWLSDEKESKEEHLSYFYFPDAYLDKQINLLYGMKNFRKVPDSENVANFPAFLNSLQQYEQKLGKKVKADIIAFRGVMTKLLTLPYNLNNEIHLYVMAYDGQIFIKNDDVLDLKRRAEEEEKLSSDPEKEKHMKTCEFVGYKFETMTTLKKPWAETARKTIEKRHKQLVNNYEQYISVVRSGVGKVKTLLAGEVDCLWDYLPEEPENVLPHYAELKTSRVLQTPQHAFQFENKLFRTWAQCFLLGITRMIYGFRDDNYVLRDVEVYNTDEVPVLIKDNAIPGRKGPKIVCMNALKWYGAVLDWIVKNVDANDELKVYKIDYDLGSRSFMLSECMGNENKELRNGGILTEEFKAWRETLKSQK